MKLATATAYASSPFITLSLAARANNQGRVRIAKSEYFIDSWPKISPGGYSAGVNLYPLLVVQDRPTVVSWPTIFCEIVCAEDGSDLHP